MAARYDGPVIVQKGPHDAMSDGKQTVVCKVDGSPRRAGGQVRASILSCIRKSDSQGDGRHCLLAKGLDISNNSARGIHLSACISITLTYLVAAAVCRDTRAHTLQGDVLSGTLAAFTAWTVNSKDGGAAAAEQSGVPALLLAAYGATRTVRHASEVSLFNVHFPTLANVAN